MNYWHISSAAGSAGKKRATVMLYGLVAGSKLFDDDQSPYAIAQELDAQGDLEHITVRINSPGGNVFAGNAIHNILKQHPAPVTCYIDGLAASAASIVAMAGDEVVMPANGMLMIHGPSTYGRGTAADLRAAADMLDQVEQGIISVYAEKTGLPRDEIKAMLDAETWLTAEKAVALGFADRLDAQPVAACLDGERLVVNGLAIDDGELAVPEAMRAALLTADAVALAAPPEEAAAEADATPADAPAATAEAGAGTDEAPPAADPLAVLAARLEALASRVDAITAPAPPPAPQAEAERLARIADLSGDLTPNPKADASPQVSLKTFWPHGRKPTGGTHS